MPTGYTADVITMRDDPIGVLVCVTAVIDLPAKFNDGSELRHSVEWAEVSTQHRRRGIWTELRKAIEQHYGCEVEGDGATDEGDAFLNAWDSRGFGFGGEMEPVG